MSIEEKEHALREFKKLITQLEKAGVEHSISKPHCVMFDGPHGECMAFPSQTYDGKLVVVFQVKERCDTADEVLEMCGLREER